MALQTIDTVNIPEIVPSDVELKITKFGQRSHKSSYDPVTNAHLKNVQFSSFNIRDYLYFNASSFITDYDLNHAYFPSGSYGAVRSYFRLFIGNYATVSSLKLVFEVDEDFFDEGGRQMFGYTPGVETRLKIFQCPVNVETTHVWSTYLAIIPGANLIESVSVAGGVATITFNAAGRALFTGISAGYIDLGAWITPSECVPMPEPRGYCLTSKLGYEARTARILINY